MQEMKIYLWALDNTAAIIIEDEKSPIIYSNQTGGYACRHPETNGYLVPVEFNGNIARKFLNNEYEGSGWELDNSFYDDVPEIMAQLQDYFCEDYNFELDESKIDENTESWVYLVCKRGKPDREFVPKIIEGFPDTFTAILTWPNSD